MRKFLLFSILICISTISIGCSSFTAPMMPPHNPGGVNIFTGTINSEVTGGMPIGSKTGISKSFGILGLVALGDSSLNTAIASGGLESINTIDYDYLSILGVYSQVEIIVTGD